MLAITTCFEEDTKKMRPGWHHSVYRLPILAWQVWWCTDHSYYEWEGKKGHRKWKPLNSLNTALLHTCRQTYYESISIFYSSIIYNFWTIRPIFHFLKIVPPQRLQCITEIRMHVDFRNLLPLPHSSTKAQTDYEGIWTTIETSFTRLQRLYLAFLTPGDAMYEDKPELEPGFEEAWLPALERFLTLVKFEIFVQDAYSKPFGRRWEHDGVAIRYESWKKWKLSSKPNKGNVNSLKLFRLGHSSTRECAPKY